ncbi:MAG: hypothetical protein R2754_00115 [Microthrixaceae bacterium]
MPSAYPPNDEPTSADRPDWSKVVEIVRYLRNNTAEPHQVADLDQAHSALMDLAKSWNLPLATEAEVHAYFIGMVAGSNTTSQFDLLASLAPLLPLIPEDVR